MSGTVYLSAASDTRLAKWLAENFSCRIEYVHTEGIVAGPVSDHPDMFLCRLGIDEDAPVVSCPDDPSLTADYPHDIAYNAACTGKYFIHNLKYTAPALLQRAADMGFRLIDVRQGYSKCSTVIVDEDSVITYDCGIGAACRAAGMNVLMVCPGHVLLPGYNTGFIGGASGRIGDTIVFNGDLSAHPDFESILEFIKNRSLKLKWFDEWPLTDIGSII